MNCPFCNQKLQVVDVDFESQDVHGCADCDWVQPNNDDDMMFFI